MNELKDLKVTEFPKHETNPFEESFALKVIDSGYDRTVSYVRKDGVVVSPEGEVLSEGELIMGKEHRVDKERFIKVYVESLLLFTDLSKRAVMLFTQVLRRLEKGRTVVYMIPQELCGAMEISEPTYYRALSELLAANVLARHKSSSVMYFINPTYIFNGNRMTIVNRFIMDNAIKERGNGTKKLRGSHEDIESNKGFEE